MAKGKAFDFSQTRAYLTGVLIEHAQGMSLAELSALRNYAGLCRIMSVRGKTTTPNPPSGGRKSERSTKVHNHEQEIRHR